MPDVFPDARGYFKETYSRDKYAALGMHDDWVQDSVSRSRRNVIRGMHCDLRMAKLVQALQGTIYDVIVDLRRDRRPIKRWEGFELIAAITASSTCRPVSRTASSRAATR